MPELPPPPTSPASPASRLAARGAEVWASLALRTRVVWGAVLALVAVATAVVLAVGVGAGGGPVGQIDLPRAATRAAAGAEPVFAHAAGAVARPGLYKLPAGSRVADLVQAAGGPVEGADIDQLNLAAVVNDGERIYIARQGEVAAGTGSDASAPTGPGGRLDLNAATQAQLEDLPGVGPATATAILDERKRRGRFKRVEDLLEVRGIGPAKFEQLRSLVRV